MGRPPSGCGNGAKSESEFAMFGAHQRTIRQNLSNLSVKAKTHLLACCNPHLSFRLRSMLARRVLYIFIAEFREDNYSLSFGANDLTKPLSPSKQFLTITGCQEIEICDSMSHRTLTYPSCITANDSVSNKKYVDEHLRNWIRWRLNLFLESGCHLNSSKQAPEWEIQGKGWKDLIANLCPNINVLFQRQWLNPCQEIEACGSMSHETLTYPSCIMATILSRISVVAEHLQHWIWSL